MTEGNNNEKEHETRNLKVGNDDDDGPTTITTTTTTTTTPKMTHSIDIAFIFCEDGNIIL